LLKSHFSLVFWRRLFSNMMKTLMVIFGCLLAVNFALKCQHSRSKIRGEGNEDLSMRSQDCGSGETWCVTAKGNDKQNGTSVSFTYRGCYSKFEMLNETYHNPYCPDGGSIINNALSISGTLTCCTGDNCNSPASTYSFSAFLLVLSISALFYDFSW
jgi:hypothetical protein